MLHIQHKLAEQIADRIVPLVPPHSSVLVGLSGGVDSVVLLHLLHKLTARHSWQLTALHVHHNLSPNADAWAQFCAELCARYYITLHLEHVDITPLRAHGIEAAARQLRHAAFLRQQSDFIALAHHADDQAETLLLQLLRGAGVRGASAMPVLAAQPGRPALLRPLLHCARQEILDYATAHNLRWVEDESNRDTSYPRNFLRQRVFPLLREKFPAYRATLARSAQHFAETSRLLDELAQQDAGQALHADTLEVGALQALTVPRARNLLRYFLHCNGAPMPQTVQLDDMLRQLCNARTDAQVQVDYDVSWQVRRYQGKVYVTRALGEFDPALVLPWQGEAELPWPALNAQLQFRQMVGQGISAARLQHAPVTLRFRRGGERLRPQLQAATRSLKNLLQEHHIPPWQRERWPLLYCGDELVCVPGVAIAADYQTTGTEAGITPALPASGRRTGNAPD